MTTDVTRWENGGQVERAATRGVMRLVDWAQEADAAYQLAQKLTGTAFCPEQFRGKPADAAAAMLAGGELGLSPLTALGAFDVIQGRAAARAITLRALAQSQGHEIVLVESTTTRCRMKGRRAGSTEWQSIQWTIDRAKELGLTGKDNWRKQPQAMLIARATSELARLIASDALLGIGGGYSAEEVADGATGDVALTVEPDPDAPATPAPGRRTLSRPRTTEPPQESQSDQSPAEDATPAEQNDEDGITKAQLTKIAAGLADIGVTHSGQSTAEARAARLAYVAAVVGREVASSKELTRAEGHQVIEAIEFDLTQPDQPTGGAE